MRHLPVRLGWYGMVRIAAGSDDDLLVIPGPRHETSRSYQIKQQLVRPQLISGFVLAQLCSRSRAFRVVGPPPRHLDPAPCRLALGSGPSCCVARHLLSDLRDANERGDFYETNPIQTPSSSQSSSCVRFRQASKSKASSRRIQSSELH